MRQRVGIARAIALQPRMLLLDEPFGMLDQLTRMELQDVLIELWQRDHTTALMVTHDVDEALFLADRVAMMTSGPAARLGAVLTVPFARPRRRAAVLEHPDYYRLREELIGFLEDQAHSSPLPQGEGQGEGIPNLHAASSTARRLWRRTLSPPLDRPAAVAAVRPALTRGGLPMYRRATVGFGRALVALLALAVWPVSSGAQTAAAPAPPPAPPAASPLPLAVPQVTVAGPWGSTVRLEVVNRIRGEFVDWFATAPTSATPNYRYNFLGNKFQLGVRVKRDPYELFVQFQDSTIANVPDNGVGVGATYYANTHRSLQNGAILRNAWIGTRRILDQPISGRAGRLLYSDGLDVPATAPNLNWIQYNRIGQRLIGPFDYTHVGRSFDGGHIGYDYEMLNLTGFGFVPTFGGYEVDANRQLDITLGGLALNLKESEQLGPMIGRLFWYYYGDQRDVLYVDNRPLPVRQAAVGEHSEIHTLGGHLARLQPLGPGIIDGFAYAFGQLGDYQDLDQSAWAYGVEAGYRLPNVWARPWMRAGVNSGSGDDDPTDDTHGTFFQLLPTAWLYAQFPFYNMMNNQDVFVQWILDPHPMVSFKLDGHWLRLNASEDLAYAGGGATKNDLFGYSGINGNGRSELAYLLHFMLTVRPTAFMTVNGFYAHAWGQGVINQAFAGTDGNYGFIEVLLSF